MIFLIKHFNLKFQKFIRNLKYISLMSENKIITFEDGWLTIDNHLKKLYRILMKLYQNEPTAHEDNFTRKEYSETYT